jgi:phenylacetate-CoA ligase
MPRLNFAVDQFREMGERALHGIIGHAAQHSPYYRDQAWAKRLRAGQTVDLFEIPPTTKETVLQKRQVFYCDVVRQVGNRVITKYTSGSTGEPLEVRKTQHHFAVNAAENQRLALGWMKDGHVHSISVEPPDAENPIASIKHMVKNDGKHQWRLYARSADPLIELLHKVKATLISTRPSIATALLAQAPQHDFIRLVCTVGETIHDELQQRVAALPDCKLYDNYGCVEVGLIAGLCRECGNYHYAARNSFVELVGDDDRPVNMGQVGRLLVTCLTNDAMPLLRYDLKDYAIGTNTPFCSRAPFGLKRILGRERTLFKLPDGSRIMPALGAKAVSDLGVKRFKLVQTSLQEVEFRYMLFDGRTELPTEPVQAMISAELSPHFRAVPVLVTEFPLSASGKYLMHETLI